MAYFAVSVDTPETNRKFAESLGVDYPILSDPKKDVARAYGVLGVGGLVARRVTVYIGKDGKILAIDEDVHTRTAGADVAAELAKLGIPKRK